LIVLALVLVVVGVAFLIGSFAMQLAGINVGNAQAPKYVWREFRRFGRGSIELGLIALCLTVVLH
jgi:hypothetical protein